MTSGSRLRAAVAALSLLVVASATPSASAVVGPGDFEQIEQVRRLVADELLPVVYSLYDVVACDTIGGSLVAHPPGASDTGLLACSDPWCYESLIVSVMCFEKEQFTRPNPDPTRSGICVVYQTVTPAYIEVPDQDAMTPLYVRCFDPLMHTSLYAGYCGFVVQAFCMHEEMDRECIAYSTAVGCSDLFTGECVDDVQAFCIGYHHPLDGSPPFRTLCAVWVEAAELCVTPNEDYQPPEEGESNP